MANEIKVKVDGTRAYAKFDRMPVSVRDQLRAVIPDLTKRLGALVNAKLDSELRSRRRLSVTEQMIENPREILGRVGIVATSAPLFLPNIIETGARAHEIKARNARALSFFWEKIGQNVMFKRVQHPGYPGIHPMQRSFDEMKGEIVQTLEEAGRRGAQEAGR